jgi:hypothetical protein
VRREQCRANTRTGERCRAFAGFGDFCMNHSPLMAERMRESRARGAANAAKLKRLEGRRERLNTLPSLVRFCASVVHRVLEGDLDARVAQTAINGLSLQRQLIEAGDLAERLEKVEARLPVLEAPKPPKRGERWA